MRVVMNVPNNFYLFPASKFAREWSGAWSVQRAERKKEQLDLEKAEGKENLKYRWKKKMNSLHGLKFEENKNKERKT